MRVKWVNDLVDPVTGFHLPPLLPVDQTLHWANPGGEAGRDSHGMDPAPYLGPVPIVTHLHGAHVGDHSDGYPEAWYLPDAADIPAPYARQGSRFDQYDITNTEPGTAVYQYSNDQAATTLWYHDHALGMTRANVYAGLSGFYLLRGGPYDAPKALMPRPFPKRGDAAGKRYREIPLAIQDRSFNEDGSFFYPDTRAFFDGFEGPYAPESDIAPIWNPEYFGNFMMVNGRTWPALEVEKARYRLRILNGCGSRFLMLKIVGGDPAARPAAAALPFWVIGTDGGFIGGAPQVVDRLLVAPAERYDVIVDFHGMAPGTSLYLVNEGPDEPFGGGEPGEDFAYADPVTTGQILRFDVVRRRAADTSRRPERLNLPSRPALPAEIRERQISLNEAESDVLPGVAPKQALLGTVDADGLGVPLMWNDPVTENPGVGDTEVWEIHNYTEDAHPIHVHLVQFEVVEREGPDGDRGPEPWEAGPKDTVIAYPGEVTRIRAHFDLAGLYVWHCHILEHEDHEMMRPFTVGP